MLKSLFKNIHAFISGFLLFLKKHFGFVTLLLFLLALAGAGYIFFIYGYRVAFTEPEVSAPQSTIDEKGLDAMKRYLDAKKKAQDTIVQKTFSNPFIQSPPGSPR